MRNFVLKFFVLKLLVLLAIGCAFNNSESKYSNYKNIIEVRKVGEFEGIHSSGAWDVFFMQGSDCTLRLEGDSHIIENTITKIENGVLYIKIDLDNYFFKTPLKAFVTMKDVKSITVRGSGDFKAETDIKANDFRFKSTGSGDCHLNNIVAKNSYVSISGSGDLYADSLQANSLDGITKGSGDIKINHLNVGNFSLQSSGSGDFFVKDFDVQNIKLSAKGSGDFSLEGIKSQELTGTFSGSGDNLFSGEIDFIKIKQSGSGDVKATNLNARHAEINLSGSSSGVMQVADKLDLTLKNSSSFRCVGDPSIGEMKLGRGTSFVKE